MKLGACETRGDSLRALLADYSYALRNVIALLAPNAAKSSVAPLKGARRERALERYKKPNNGKRSKLKAATTKR